MKSGSARLTAASRLKRGIVNTGCASDHEIASVRSCPCQATKAVATASTITTA